MAPSSPVKVVLGGIGFTRKNKEEVQEMLDILEKHHVQEIDASP
jgi:metal-dependent hydrolase (beta-lactamase superfamily II)